MAAHGPDAETHVIEFRLLGAFEVASGGRPLPIGSAKQRRLLAMLAVNLNQPVSLDELLEELWDGRPPVTAVTTAQGLVSRLRRLLTGTRDAEDATRVTSRPTGYVLEARPDQVDANRFDGLTGRGRDALARGDPASAAVHFEEALGLWRGPPLADMAERDFARPVATRLAEARSAAVEDFADAKLALGRPGEALVVLDPHIATNALRERAWGQRMVALYRLGRQADALRAYQDIRRLLGEELGLEPNPALRRLEQQILQQSSELDGPAPADPAPAPGTAAGGGREPGDTIAFLFTDIEASTRRWEGDPEAMARDLSRHDELLRGAVDAAGGHVFSHTGDGLCAAFPTASAALGAAMAAQHALTGQQWTGAAPLRVRMAVHAGAAERVAETYFGPTLNRTARLMGLASGGQVLCSQAAAELARDRLPAGTTLVDLGQHRLADLSRPERVFQVTGADRPALFPPLRSQSAPRHNLPLALTSFVGRGQELDELEGLTGSSRLITLAGVGGAGKTRFALEVATRCLSRFPDGVWLVDLGPLRDPALVASEVAAALGLLTGSMSHGPGDVEGWLAECLLPRQLLVVLDNCEHVVEAVARVARELLTRCPGIHLLATSREVLGLPGEVVWTVPPLSLPAPDAESSEELAGSDAVALFCERARAVQPAFGLTEANAAAVAQICRRLDGIPLALELAAARIRVLGAAQVAERLDRRFQLLTEPGRGGVERHQTLWAAMDWSYQLLPPGEQAALRRLAVFPGGFDLEAAEAVVAEAAAVQGLGFPVLDLLFRLVEKSLVLVQDEGDEARYRLLETVREYAFEKLAEAGETEGTQQRHRNHFLSLADGWRERSESASRFHWHEPWVRGGELEQDNFRAALEWSLARDEYDPALRMLAALWLYWWYAGSVDVRGWLERALAGPALSPDRARWEALIALALKHEEDGDGEGAESLAAAALELAEQLGHTQGVAFTQVIVGIRVLGRGDRERARRLLTEALAQSEALGDPTGCATCHHDLGWIALGDGDQAGARSHFEQALEISRRHPIGETLGVHFLAAAAPAAALAGEAAQAEALAAEGVARARELRLRRVLVMALVRAAETALLTGNFPQARALVGELLVLLAELGARRWVADTIELAAVLVEADGRAHPAARLFDACDAVRQALGEPPGGLRAVTPTVQASRDRLADALGRREPPEDEAPSIERVLAEALEWLELRGTLKPVP